MTNNTMNKGKQIGVIVLVLVALVCVGVIVWWSLVQAYAPNKVIYNTYNVGEIQTVDGTNKKNVIEVRYYSNDKGNGVEMLDVKFNEFLDEEKQMLYSQGIQFVANTPDDSLSDWGFSLKKTGIPVGVLAKRDWWASYDYLPNGTIHTYASADDYATTLNDAQALGGQDDFKIELKNAAGDKTDLYLMEMQGTNTKVEEALKIASTGEYGVNVYAYNDVYCLSKKIYDKIQGLTNGTTRSIVFDFDDMFEFKHYENGAYLDDNERETAKVKTRLQAYYVVKVEVFENGAVQSGDSLFNNIKGSSSFILDGDYEDNDYYIGKSQINLTIDNMTVRIGSYGGPSGIILKEKEGLVEALTPYKANIELSIIIDTRQVITNTPFMCFAQTSRLPEFNIKEIIVKETINNILVIRKVAVKDAFTWTEVNT